MLRAHFRNGSLAWLTRTLALTATAAPAVTAVICLTTTARADGFIVIEDAVSVLPGPGPRPNPPPRHYPWAPLEVKYHYVNVKIVDQVAVTEVEESFFNPNNQPLEGTYLFPIPVGAQFDKFSMDINGKATDAELLDADKARKIYEDIVRKARDPALLEYAGQGLFKARIFPLEALSEKHVKIKYTQVLKSDSGMVGYTYPLNTEKFSAAPLERVTINVELEMQQPLTAVYCPSHNVEIQRHGERAAKIGFEAKSVKPDTDFQLFFGHAEAADVGLNLLTYNDGDPNGGYFMLLASPSAQTAQDKVVAKDVVFVLDTSGSMADNNKIEQAKKALQFCLHNLNDGDRFEIVRFATEAQSLFDKLSPADDKNRAQARKFVQDIKAAGGTAIEAALTKALTAAQQKGDRERPVFIVFLTDGMPTVGETNEDKILDSATKAMGDRPMRIFCFGIGADVNTHLLDKVAERTRAATTYVLPQEDIEVKVSNFFAKISQPVLANPQLTVAGGVKFAQTYPVDLPDLFKGEQCLLFGRYSGGGAAGVTLAGTVNGQKRSFAYDAKFADKSTANDFIPKLWATRRVGYLLDQVRLHGENNELKNEITALARQYGIVTPYTAYLIVEDEKQRNVPVAARTLQAIDQDAQMSFEVGAVARDANKLKSGGGAVAGAQGNQALGRADNIQAPASAPKEYARTLRASGYAGGSGIAVAEALANQQNRVIRGRAFFQNGAQWIDTQVQARPNAQQVALKFNSDEYFKLLADHPETAQWLALGANVQFVLADTVYNVTE